MQARKFNCVKNIQIKSEMTVTQYDDDGSVM